MNSESAELAAARSGPSFFISHSEHDQALAESLIRLLEGSMHLRGGESIRCTSSPGYGAQWGNVSARLKADLTHCVSVIVLFTPESIKSAWVWLECGAAWMENPDKIIPIFTSASLLDAVPFPISTQNAVFGDGEGAGSVLWDFLCAVAREHNLPLSNSGSNLDRLNKFIRELKITPDSANVSSDPGAPPIVDFCEISREGSERRRKYLAGAKEGENTLFHTYLRVVENRSLRAVHDAIEGFFKVRPAHLHDVVLWSLLGSMELAVTFRASAAAGERIQQQLVAHIRRSGALGFGDQGAAMEVQHHGLSKEYVWNDGVYIVGRRAHDLKFLRSDRITHAFIRLNYRETGSTNHQEAVERLKELFNSENALQGEDLHVDLYALTDCERVVVIEMHVPCGRQGNIKRLSRALETELGNWNKDTFIVYDMNVLGRQMPVAQRENPGTR